MAIRGQRVLIDLDDSDEEADVTTEADAGDANLLGDVMERRPASTGDAKVPSAARSSTATGFPAHRKRTAQSRFKSGRKGLAVQGDAAVAKDTPTPRPASGAATPSRPHVNEERRQIDEENRERLADMSDGEILDERRELMESLGPGVLQALLRRSTLDDGGSDADFPGIRAGGSTQETGWPPRKARGLRKKVAFAVEETSAPLRGRESDDDGAGDGDEDDAGDGYGDGDGDGDDDMEAALAETSTGPADHDTLPSTGSIHFPKPSQPPSLDPDAPDFLEDLHKKYFPSLPSDPSKLEWMRSPSHRASSTTGNSQSYSPDQAGLEPKEIRFSFLGTLIPPSAAAVIPVTAGLHHHGDAPDAAGYTISELAGLARSTVPAQRCVAFQTLGRILYRLGRGEFGDPSEGEVGVVGAEDTLGELARGLWREVEGEKVVEICTGESEVGRHVSARAYATEALWLWQKGGGRRWRTD